MLFEFHRQQNAKKPKSVFATYLVTGIQEIDASELPVKAIDGDGDVPMQSSPYMSSPAPPQSLQEEPLKQRVITLVKEEHLDGEMPFCSVKSLLQLIRHSCQAEVSRALLNSCL